MRVTKKQLNTLLDGLKSASGINTLELEYSSIYGGYRLVNVNPVSGGHYGAFGESSACPRISAREMYIRLSSLIAGLNHK